MNHSHPRLGPILMSLLAGVVLVSQPTAAGAAALGFKNKTTTSIYIEAASIVRNRVVRANPLLINPGKVGGHQNLPPGKWLISVYDANKPSRMMLQGTIFMTLNQDLFFSVERARLVQTKPPK